MQDSMELRDWTAEEEGRGYTLYCLLVVFVLAICSARCLNAAHVVNHVHQTVFIHRL